MEITNNFNTTDEHLGRHVLAEFYDCDPNILNNKDGYANGIANGFKNYLEKEAA